MIIKFKNYGNPALWWHWTVDKSEYEWLNTPNNMTAPTTKDTISWLEKWLEKI